MKSTCILLFAESHAALAPRRAGEIGRPWFPDVFVAFPIRFRGGGQLFRGALWGRFSIRNARENLSGFVNAQKNPGRVRRATRMVLKL